MRRSLLPSLLPLLAVACSGPQDHEPAVPQPCPTAAPAPTSSASAEPTRVAAPASLVAAQGTVSTLTSRAEIPLTGLRVDGKAGDLMIDDGEAAVVVTQEGRIVDYGRKGAGDEMVWLNPTIAFGLSALDTPVKKLEAAGHAIRMERDVAGKPALLITWVYLKGAELHVETVVQGTGDDPALAMTLGERLSWGNFPTWMDAHGWVKDAAKITGGFLARDGLGVAYAVCSENGPLYAKFDEQEFAGFFEPARTGESVILVPAHGVSAPRSIVVTTSGLSMGDAVMALSCGPRAAGPTHKVAIKLPPLTDAPRLVMEISRCAEGGGPGKPFLEYRSRLETTSSPPVPAFDPIELPQGCFRARLSAPGYTAGAWVDPEKMVDPLPANALPAAGKLAFSVMEGGKPLPARVVVRGEGTTPDPDWGDNASETGAASNVAVAGSGAGTLPLPAGKYKVMVTRGFEYTIHEEKIEIKVGKTATLKAKLDRVVDTKGWVTADLHLHAVPSSDAPSLLSDRIQSLAASGIEVAVATDHNAVTDYRPVIDKLGLKDRIFGVIGDEITTRDAPFGHFNAFPLEATTQPFTYKDTTPAAIFKAVHANKPYEADTILQVNHPRMGGIGYFDLLRFDPTDIPGWLKRAPLADMSFDAIEVFNGDHYARINKVEEVLSDWFALLNAGYRPTATGNSDSHRVSFHEPGVPRNLVQLGVDDPSKVDERAFVDAIRHGRVVVSSGPFVTFEIAGKGIGDTVPAGEQEITVTVDAPPWVDVSEVSLIKRGEGLTGWKLDKKSGKPPWHFKTKATLKKGDWVIAIVRGTKPMTYLYRPNATPFAFTNPIFVN